jgi:hypothetical protein
MSRAPMVECNDHTKPLRFQAKPESCKAFCGNTGRRSVWPSKCFSMLAALLAFSLAGPLTMSSAWAFSLMTWNVGEGSVEAVTRREPDIRQLRVAVEAANNGQLPDAIVLQEVTSYAAAMRVARALGYASGTVATSDAGDDREIWPFALELAVVTSRPVISVVAYQARAERKPFVIDLQTGDTKDGRVEPIIVPAAVALPAEESNSTRHPSGRDRRRTRHLWRAFELQRPGLLPP